MKERNRRSEAFAFVIGFLPLCGLIEKSDHNSDRRFGLSRRSGIRNLLFLSLVSFTGSSIFLAVTAPVSGNLTRNEVNGIG